MKTGSTVRDEQGTTWTVGQELWRGPCARTFVARSSDGKEGLLSISRGSGDFTGQDSDELAALCATVVRERITWMKRGDRPWQPPLLATCDNHEGRALHVVPRYPATLAHRIRAGAPLAGLLDALIAACRSLVTHAHGDLRPEHVLLAEDGGVRLLAPLTATQQAHAERLLHASNHSLDRVIPPEATGAPGPGWDTYAICLALYKAAALAPAGADGRRADPPALPEGGLDKVALSAVKDRVHARLQQERANPRFSSRVSEKLGAVLNRGLSRQPAPSPPYRFGDMAELAGRLEEVRQLIDPKVLGVGKVLLAPSAKDGMFEGGADAAFSTTVTVTPGVSHDDLATGLLVRDLDADGDDRVPIPDARYAVKPHPSGRLRFDFELPELRPGRYTIRVAFTVKDSGHEPETTDGHFEIRPPPGYVPPAEEPPPEASALRFPGAGPTPAEPPGMDEPDHHEPPDTDPFGDAAFPSPIAPSDPGSSAAADAPPPPVLRAVPTPVDASTPAPTVPPGFDAPSEPSQPSLGIAPATNAQVRAAEASTPAPTATAPAIAPVPSIRPSDPSAAVSHDTTPSADASGWGPSGASWEKLPGLDDPAPTPATIPYAERLEPGSDYEGPAGGLLPSPEGMQDLPGFDDPKPDPVAAVIAQITTFLQDNLWLALAVVVGVLVLGLVLAGLLFQAIAG